MQENQLNSQGMDIQIDANKVDQYKEKAQKFDAYFQQMQENYQKSQQKIYYIVSCRFIKEWKTFCVAQGLTRRQPHPMNFDIVDQQTKNIRDGLSQSQNYEIVDEKIFQLFQGFPIYQVLRRVAHGQPGNKIVPIKTLNLNFLTLSQADLQQFDKKNKRRHDLKLRLIKSLSQSNTAQDFINQIQKQQMVSRGYKLRLWKHDKQVNLDILFNHIIQQCRPKSYPEMKIKSKGKLVQDNEVKLAELQIKQDDYFILQCIQHGRIVITSADQGRCDSCYNYAKITHRCQCKAVIYCSESCLQRDKRYHLPRCRYAQEEQLRKPILMVLGQKSRRGLVGLQNMGNTCFMNSCLQCLSHTKPLTNYFLNRFYQTEINKENPIGSQGKLAQAYAAFIKNTWCQQSNVYRPLRIKNAVADINKMFSGYAQHDSQQFFSFLVDGLHEDLNRIKKKPYVQSVDSNGRSDDVVSIQSWSAYMQRNQSVVTDTMVGQYKSKVTCPDCNKQSITFDPFITVTLPIPQKSAIPISFYVLYDNFKQNTEKITVTYKNRNIKQILNKVTQLINRRVQDILLYVLTFQENVYGFHNTPKGELFSKIQSQRSSIFVIQLSKQEQNIQNRVQLVFRFSKKQYYSFKAFWFKRPFYFNKQTAKGIDLVRRVLQYFYNEAYDYSQLRVKKIKQSQKESFFKRNRSNQKERNPISYQDYEQIMLKQRPFKLYLRSNKKLKLAYGHSTQCHFQQQQLIGDEDNICQKIKFQNLSDYEIDVKFSSDGLQDFTINRLTNYDQKESQQKGSRSIFGYSNEEKTATLDECFQALQLPQLLQKGNEWYCSNCKEHKLATKQMYIYKTPEILILHLKRFKVKGVISKQKNETDVQFPLQIDISKYVVSTQPINSYITDLQQKGIYQNPSYHIPIEDKPKSIYELYAISNHYGSLGGGHYTAYANNNGRWYSFNDSSVSAVETSRIKGSGAYILFYSRKRC